MRSEYTTIPVGESSWSLFTRGERTVNHVQDKGISKGHRQHPRLWDSKEQQFEAQNWHHNSTRSFHNRAAPNNGYLTGPAERYATWDNNVGNSVVSRADQGTIRLSKVLIFFTGVSLFDFLS